MKLDWDKIEFKDEKRFLSNMYKSEILFNDLHGIDIGINPTNLKYGSSEHLYQSLKSKNLKWHLKLCSLEKPESTKIYAKKYLKTLLFDNEKTFELREDFHKIKVDIMRLVIRLKFTQNKDLREKLISLNEKIEEKNCWNDTFWGTCNGVGKNILGKILENEREYWRNIK